MVTLIARQYKKNEAKTSLSYSEMVTFIARQYKRNEAKTSLSHRWNGNLDCQTIQKEWSQDEFII